MDHADFLNGTTTVVFDNVDRTHFGYFRRRIGEEGSFYFKKKNFFLRVFEMDWSRRRSSRTKDLVKDARKGEATDSSAFLWMKEEVETREKN